MSRHPIDTAPKTAFSRKDLDYALMCAADFLESEEWPDDGTTPPCACAHCG